MNQTLLPRRLQRQQREPALAFLSLGLSNALPSKGAVSALLLAGSASGGNNAHALQGVDGCEILSGRQASKCEEYGDLISADLTDALLTRADLTRSDLTDADLTDALLTGADLSGVDLYRTSLTGVDLDGADLTRANPSGANLAGADPYRVFGWETVKGKTAIRILDAAHGVPGG